METKVHTNFTTAGIPTFAEFLAERQYYNRQVPSPSKSAAADLGNWPSFYGNSPNQSEQSKEAYLGQYIHKIYCRECREQEDMAAASHSSAGGASGSGSPGTQPNSPPQSMMDQMTLAEKIPVLNRRLMFRRSRPELVSAGIYPSSPHAFAGQRVLLERAKTGDILKHKIEQRPDREFLVQHHILEDSNVDPSLQSAQRKLKKAKLTDELNEKLAHRPGPLELVEQRILEADDPIKAAIREGKLDFHKTEEGVEPASIAKLPYEIESPKSGTSSPEPDCDSESSVSSGASTGFQTAVVPPPPDITPLLSTPTHTSITIGGKTLKIPITTTQSFPGGPIATVTVSAPTIQQLTSIPHIHKQQASNFGANRNIRRTTKNNRPKQQMKQRVIKFHEYKGPSASKSSNTNSSNNGSFVTTRGPLQKLDGLTPYQVRVHQQQLYLQCQLEVQSKGEGSVPSTVLLPIQTPATTASIIQQSQQTSPLMQQALLQQPLSQPSTPAPQHPADKLESPATPRPPEPMRSRPVTPSLSVKSPSMSQLYQPHTPLHVTRSLSHLEDMKVSDLKLELRQRNLTVSGPKPQLIERLRKHQLQEMSTNVPSVSSTNSSDYGSTNIPSVQSLPDDILMAPPSVASTSGLSSMRSPPPTPCSPQEEFMKSPASVQPKGSNGSMDVDEGSNQNTKSTAEIVREQAKQIEELKRTLQQFQQQFSMVQQPFVVSQSPVPHNRESMSEPQSPQQIPTPVQHLTSQQLQVLLQQQQLQQQRQQHQHQQLQQQPIQLQTQQMTQVVNQQSSPVDITDKQVYLATPDGKMQAYKVVLHTGNGVVQPLQHKQESSTLQQQPPPPPPLLQQTSNIDMLSPSTDGGNHLGTEQMPPSLKENGESSHQPIDVEDVLEVLIRTGEIDPRMMNSDNNRPSLPEVGNANQLSSNVVPDSSQSSMGGGIVGHPNLELHEPLSPLLDMEWMDSDHTNGYLGMNDENTATPLDTNDNEFNYENNLDWLSDVISMEAHSPGKGLHSSYDQRADDSSSTSDPILTPKPTDMMNIFELDETNYRSTPDSGINWDKLIGETSNHL